MINTNINTFSDDFLKSLGFPTLAIHQTFGHCDFTQPGRRMLLIGPMGSGKTEYSARIWQDSIVAQKKGKAVKDITSTGIVDRRNVFFIRNYLDKNRFETYPDDALSYRSGYVRCGENIAKIRDSFDLEKVVQDNPTVGTYIIDEASFFDERLAYVVRNLSVEKGIMFIFPTLILNFRRDIFNSTARLMLEVATDVIPLTAYCEHNDCIKNAFYTYRYYTLGETECPALYFDPLIVVGGDKQKEGSNAPNYQSRCDEHHFLPGKEYTFYNLKPMGEEAAKGNVKHLRTELENLKYKIQSSELADNLKSKYKNNPNEEIYLNSLKPSFIAEKALIYLFNEQNLVTEETMIRLVSELNLDKSYMSGVLSDNKRPVSFEQGLLF